MCVSKMQPNLINIKMVNNEMMTVVLQNSVKSILFTTKNNIKIKINHKSHKKL